jgi:hypothetical protein
MPSQPHWPGLDFENGMCLYQLPTSATGGWLALCDWTFPVLHAITTIYSAEAEVQWPDQTEALYHPSSRRT